MRGATPARSARPTPSPSAAAGFEVCSNSAPSPPVASTTLGARNVVATGAAASRDESSAATPTHRRGASAVTRSVARTLARSATRGCARAAATMCSVMALPVWSFQ